jgi:hypothetical protein
MADSTQNTVAAMKDGKVQRIGSALGVGDALPVTPAYLRWTVKYTNLGTTYADHNLVDGEDCPDAAQRVSRAEV